MTDDETRGPADERRPLGSDELAAIRARADALEAAYAEMRTTLQRLVDVDMGLREHIEKPMFLAAWGVMVVQEAKSMLATDADTRGRALLDRLAALEAAGNRLATALEAIDRKLDVARLGLDRNGPQHARITEAREMVRAALVGGGEAQP